MGNPRDELLVDAVTSILCASKASSRKSISPAGISPSQGMEERFSSLSGDLIVPAQFSEAFQRGGKKGLSERLLARNKESKPRKLPDAVQESLDTSKYCPLAANSTHI